MNSINNTLVIGIYTPCALISAVMLTAELLRRFKRQQEDYLFSLLCICTFGWSTAKTIGFLASNAEVVKYCINFGLIFIGFIPPILLLFTLRFYKVPYQPSKVIVALMLAIPAINTVMALTSRFHTLMSTQLEIISLTPLREIVLVWGPWFWVHTGYSYILMLTQIGVILFQHFRLPRFYRLPSSLMVIGVLFALIGNVLILSGLLPQAIDLTLITMSLSLILFYLAIINNNNSKFVRFSHGKLYHYLSLYILVLDEKQRVADFNQSAFNWFSSQKIVLDTASLEDITEALLHKGGNKKVLENSEGVDYYIKGEDFPVVLNLCVHDLQDANGEVIGSIAVFTDVTQNRMLIERLEEKAGIDSLTGLANHRAYDGAKKRLDIVEHFPLSVIMCDVNGLKNINDQLGHQYGDRLLGVVAEALEKVCPKQSFVARIGGDEFIYLLPRTGPEAAYTLMEQIKDALSRLENLPFTASVALGTASKFSAEEILDDVIALADSRMYEDKRHVKEQSGRQNLPSQ